MQAQEAQALLEWYIDAGVDEAIADEPVNRLVAAPEVVSTKSSSPALNRNAPPPLAQLKPNAPKMMPPTAAIEAARTLADGADTLEKLKEAVLGFEGCHLKKTAVNTVFSDGNAESDLMIIGDAAGDDEDVTGLPFGGESGALLDKMFVAIGYPREKSYLTNIVFWRPPGNRNPSVDELAICQPFIEKHIALIKPKAIAIMGGVAAKSLLKTETGITRLRGKEHVYNNGYLENEIPVEVIFHPAYLLRQPAHKKLAWEDLQKLKEKLGA